MSEPIAVRCPKCGAILKLKSRSAVGKRVPCPKCKTPFVVKLSDDTGTDDLASLDYSEAAAEETLASAPESDDFSGLPPTTGRARPKKPPKNKAARTNWKTPVLLAAVAIAVMALLGGAGYFLFPLVDRLLSSAAIDMAWLPPESDVIVRARIADTWKSPFVSSFDAPSGLPVGSAKDLLGLDPKEIQTVTIGAVGMLDASGAGKSGGLFTLGAPGLGGAQPRTVTVLRTVASFDPKQMESKLQGIRTVKYKEESLTFMGGLAGGGKVFFFPNSSTVVMGPEAEIKAAIDRGSKATPRPDLDFVPGDKQVLVVLAPRDQAYFDSRGANPLGGQALAQLESGLKGKVKTVCLGLTFNDNIDWSVAANCNSPEAAIEASAGLQKALADGRTQFDKFRGSAPPELSQLVLVLDSVINSITLGKRGSVVEVRGQVPSSAKNLAGKIPQLLLAGAGSGRGMPGGFGSPGMPQGAAGAFGNPSLGGAGGLSAAPPEQAGPPPDEPSDPAAAALAEVCKNNIQQLGLAMYTAASRINRFPDTAIRDSSGRPLLSWRVALLPHLGEQELYKEFHLDEPWDGPHNKKLIERMPAIFACPSEGLSSGSTLYLAAQGPDTMFEEGKGRSLTDVTDGTSNTILLLEVDESLAVPWTKPDDYTYDPAAPLNGLVSPHEAGLLILTADGAAHFLQQPLDPMRLAALFTRSRGEKIPPGTLK
jgi:hypothetical protein